LPFGRNAITGERKGKGCGEEGKGTVAADGWGRQRGEGEENACGRALTSGASWLAGPVAQREKGETARAAGKAEAGCGSARDGPRGEQTRLRATRWSWADDLRARAGLPSGPQPGRRRERRRGWASEEGEGRVGRRGKRGPSGQNERGLFPSFSKSFSFSSFQS